MNLKFTKSTVLAFVLEASSHLEKGIIKKDLAFVDKFSRMKICVDKRKTNLKINFSLIKKQKIIKVIFK